MYPDQDVTNTFWTFYMIFGAASLAIFFCGVFALCCCCRERFHGVQRKGYVIREPEPTLAQPLIFPAMAFSDPGFAVAPPGQPPQYTPLYTDNPPQAPQYMPPKY